MVKKGLPMDIKMRIQKEYLSSTRTAKEIAERYNICPQLVYNINRELGGMRKKQDKQISRPIPQQRQKGGGGITIVKQPEPEPTIDFEALNRRVDSFINPIREQLVENDKITQDSQERLKNILNALNNK